MEWIIIFSYDTCFVISVLSWVVNVKLILILSGSWKFQSIQLKYVRLEIKGQAGYR